MHALRGRETHSEGDMEGERTGKRKDKTPSLPLSLTLSLYVCVCVCACVCVCVIVIACGDILYERWIFLNLKIKEERKDEQKKT